MVWLVSTRWISLVADLAAGNCENTWGTRESKPMLSCRVVCTHLQHIVHERTPAWPQFEEADFATAAGIHPLRE